MDAASDLAMATLREDGFPQNTTVSFVHDGMTLYFACGTDSQKALNLARDDRLSITMTAPYDSWTQIKGLSMSARARAVTEPDEIERIGQMMLERFPQISEIEGLEESDVTVFEVIPEVVSILDYTLGFGHTEFALVSEGDVAETRSAQTHIWLPAGT
ncbi:MAG: pyridoxamine 5'-phosphate oxidase family protein [Gammaproteobacteria bacterium]